MSTSTKYDISINIHIHLSQTLDIGYTPSVRKENSVTFAGHKAFCTACKKSPWNEHTFTPPRSTEAKELSQHNQL